MKPFLRLAGLHVLSLVLESIIGTLVYLLARGGPQILVAKNIGPMIVACLTLIALQAQYLRPLFAMLVVVIAKRFTANTGRICFLMQILSSVVFMLLYRLTAVDDFQFFASGANSHSQAAYLFIVTVVISICLLALKSGNQNQEAKHANARK